MGQHLAAYGTLETIKIQIESKWGLDSEEISIHTEAVAVKLDLSPTSWQLQKSTLSRLDTGQGNPRSEKIWPSIKVTALQEKALMFWVSGKYMRNICLC